MHHPLLAIGFYGILIVMTILTGTFVVYRLIKPLGGRRLWLTFALWLVVIALCCVANYYGIRYLNDGRPPTLDIQLFLPCYFAISLGAALIRRGMRHR